MQSKRLRRAACTGTLSLRGIHTIIAAIGIVVHAGDKELETISGDDVKTNAMQRSLKFLRAQGWQCGVVEHWNPHVGIRQDLWHFADILACRARQGEDTDGIYSLMEREIALIQTFPASGWTSHVEKLQTPEIKKAIENWKAAGGIVLLHGWKKSGPRGKKKVWTVREEEI